MAQTERPASNRPFQSWLMAAFLTGLVIFTAYFFMQREWWIPELASVHGADLDFEFMATLAITGFMFIVTQLALAFLVLRFSRSGTGADHPLPGRKFEVRFAIVAASVIFLVDISLFLMGEASFRKVYGAAPEDSVVVEVTGEQFAWNFRYPGPDGQFGRLNPELIDLQNNPLGIDPTDPASGDDFIRVNQMYLPVDRGARVRLRAKDVIHSFSLPHFRVKQDAVPGMEIESWFIPTRTGEFEIVCNQLCGLGHYRMRGFLTVVTETEFEEWLLREGDD